MLASQEKNYKTNERDYAYPPIKGGEQNWGLNDLVLKEENRQESELPWD